MFMNQRFTAWPDVNASSTMSFDVTRRSVSDETYREFYCSARQVPDDILRKTLKQMGDRWEFFDTKDVATALYNEEVLTPNEFGKLTNVFLDQRDRTNDLLYKVLPAKGNEPYTLVTFYHCLLKCHINRDLPTELRAHALKICGVDRPVLVPGISESDEILQQMVAKLTACVPAEQAKNFAKSLDLNGNDIPDFPHIQLSELCQVWITKKHHECTPEALVEALICTEGLGKYASGIGAPTNPPDVVSFFYHLKNKWWTMAAFLGYSKEDLDDVITEPDNNVQRQITKFLAIFKMPDCGACTITILHKAGGKAGITSQSKREPFGLQWSPYPGMKGGSCGVSMPMLETFEDEPKPKAATASPPQLKSHGAAPLGYSWPLNIPQPFWTAAMLLPSVLPPHHCCSVHCHSPFQGQMPSYPAIPDLQTLVAQVQSLSEWQQAQCRDNEGCGDPCEQAIATLKQAEEDHVSPTINTILDAENQSSASASQNVPSSATAVTTENEVPESHSDSSKDLLTYCRKGGSDDIEIVAALLESGASLKVQTEDDGSYPLHLAVLSKSYQMLSLLVPYYDSLDMIDVVRHDHKTALMLACKEKNYEFVRILVEHTADVNTKDCDGLSCLHLKETLESPDIVQLLIDKGADVDNPTDGNNLTPLTHACVLGLTQSIEILLSGGARPDGLPGAASTPLCAAAEQDCSHVVQMLLERNANINLQDQGGFTPLLKACKAGHAGVASKLINANADKDRADKDGITPVLVAVDTNNTELLQLLVASGADVNQFKVVFSGDTEFEVTPLILAAGRGKLDIVEILVENKANVNYSSRYTVSALTYAVRGGHEQVVEYLLKVNDMIRTIDVLYAPLLVAVRSEENYILKLLLDALGGYEKALRDATDAGARDLAEALSQLDEMGRPKFPEMADGSSVANSATLQPLNPRHVHECMDRILVEVTTAAVKTAERKLGRPSLVAEARKNEYEHIVCFFEQFFASPDVGPEMFFEFINMTASPSPAVFTFENKMTFDGGTFKNILDEMNSDAIEYLPMALMQIPGFEEIRLDGEGLMQLFFGKRFFETVQCLNLLEAAKPSLQSERAATGHTHEQTTEYLQHDYSEASGHDSCLLAHRNRANEHELQDVKSDHDSYLSTQRDREDKHDLQDVGIPEEKLSVEPHSQWEEAAVEQDQLSEEGELDHQVQPVSMTDLGEKTSEERRDKLEFSRATSLPAATKTWTSPANPTTGSVRKSRIPRRVGLKHRNPRVSMPLRSASEGDEPDSHTSIPTHETDQQCRMPNSTRRQNQVRSKVSRHKDANKVSPNAEPAATATCRSRNSEQRGSASMPVRRVCGMKIYDTPVTNLELLRLYSRRVVDWKSLAKYLNVDKREIQRINRHYKLDEERCCQMLYSWHKTQGNHATHACLAQGFKEIGQEYLIKDLQKHLKDTGSHEASMMDNEIEIDLGQDTWGAEIVQLTLWLSEKRAEGFTAARIQIKLEQ